MTWKLQPNHTIKKPRNTLGEVEIIERIKEHKSLIPTMRNTIFNQVKITTSGEILGKEITIQQTGHKEITERIIKAINIWSLLIGTISAISAKTQNNDLILECASQKYFNIWSTDS